MKILQMLALFQNWLNSVNLFGFSLLSVVDDFPPFSPKAGVSSPPMYSALPRLLIACLYLKDDILRLGGVKVS